MNPKKKRESTLFYNSIFGSNELESSKKLAVKKSDPDSNTLQLPQNNSGQKVRRASMGDDKSSAQPEKDTVIHQVSNDLFNDFEQNFGWDKKNKEPNLKQQNSNRFQTEKQPVFNTDGIKVDPSKVKHKSGKSSPTGDKKGNLV